MRFKSVLKKYNVTQNDLAVRLDINRVSVCRLLNDDNDIRLSTLHKLANAIGCTVAELVSDDVTDADASSTLTLSCPHCGKTLKIIIK